MSAQAEPEFVAETLAWCNEKRAEYDKPPLDRLPKGRRADRDSCPCGEATGWTIYTSSAVSPRGVSEFLPTAMEDFIIAFDSGKLPQYDEALA